MLTKSCTYLKKIELWLLELPTTRLIALALVSTYAAILPLLLLSPFLDAGQKLGGPDMGKHHIVKTIVFGCIAAPLIETVVNQWGCIRLLRKLRCRTGVAMGVSALIFGLGHNYSGPYIFYATLVGAILATVFVVEDARKGHPFIATLAVHALRNGITAAMTLFVL